MMDLNIQGDYQTLFGALSTERLKTNRAQLAGLRARPSFTRHAQHTLLVKLAHKATLDLHSLLPDIDCMFTFFV